MNKDQTLKPQSEHPDKWWPDMGITSLRDYFAGQALVGLSIRGSAKGYGDTVKVAYKIADAMMVERAKREGEDDERA